MHVESEIHRPELAYPAGVFDRQVPERALSLGAFALLTIGSVAPSAWLGLLAAASVVTTAALGIIGDRRRLSLSLFCSIALVAAVLNPWRFWPMGFLVPLAAYALVAGFNTTLREPLITQRWGRFDRGTLGLAALTVVGSSAALAAWYALAQPDVGDLRAQIPAWPGWALLLAGLGFATVNAVIEELIWRGILWELLSRAIPIAGVVVLLQAISFGAAHLNGFPRGGMGVAMATLYGVLLGWIRHRSGGLGAPIITHIFADMTIFAILVLAMRG